MASENARPAFDAFAVDGDGESAYWTKVGGVWPHEDGKGFDIQLVAWPVNGRIVLRTPKERNRREDSEPRLDLGERKR